MKILCVIVLIYTVRETAEAIQKNSTAIAIKPITTTATTTTTTRKPFLQGIKSPCSCIEGQCGCCTGVLLDRFNQKACFNITYDPDDFDLTAAMTMNGREIFKRSISGKNPPPMCFRLPRLQFIRMCIEFSNIYFTSRNVHLCVDMEANWEDLTLVQWSFDCFRMGASGFSVVRPEDGGGLPANPIDVVDQTDEDYDDNARNNNYLFDNNCNKLIFDNNLIKLKNQIPNRNKIKIIRLYNGCYKISN